MAVVWMAARQHMPECSPEPQSGWRTCLCQGHEKLRKRSMPRLPRQPHRIDRSRKSICRKLVTPKTADLTQRPTSGPAGLLVPTQLVSSRTRQIFREFVTPAVIPGCPTRIHCLLVAASGKPFKKSFSSPEVAAIPSRNGGRDRGSQGRARRGEALRQRLRARARLVRFHGQ